VLSRGGPAEKQESEDRECRQRRRASRRAYRIAHKREIRERLRLKWRTDPSYRERQRARRQKRQREVHLKADYGISLEDYHAMLARQGGACAICRRKFDQTPCVDHCHSSGKVRGLLCRKCNIGLGFCKDDLKLMRAATAYLESSQSAPPRAPSRCPGA